MGTEERRALYLREAGRIQRCHVLPHLGSYSVAEHTYNMMALLEALHPDPSLRLFRAVLLHDAHERWTGDLPGPAGVTHPGLGHAFREARVVANARHDLSVTLDYEEARWLRALDELEFYLWCQDQLAAGNRHVESSAANMLRYIDGRLSDWPAELRGYYENYSWERSDDLGK